MERTHHTFTQNEKVRFGKVGTSIASLGVTGNWGGPDATLVLFVRNKEDGEDAAMAAIDKAEWLEATGKLPVSIILGEGSIVSIRLKNSVDPNLTVNFREVRLGRRGG